jgi:hypothetical protein
MLRGEKNSIFQLNFSLISNNFRSRLSRGNVLKLKVNFLPEIITLYKEVRNLKSLGFRVPLAIVNKAHQANQIYPFAISLIESVRTYERTLDKVSVDRDIFSFMIFFEKKTLKNLSKNLFMISNLFVCTFESRFVNNLFQYTLE